MDRESKLVFGKILGEIYRIQKHDQGISCPVGDDVIYGLLNGFEDTLNSELEELNFVSSEDVEFVSNVLNEYHIDQEKLNLFKGYYDIEHRLESNGIDRMKAHRILTKFIAEHKFEGVIAKMDSSHSPGEMRTFKIRDYES
ncbi:hypothetical protein [Paenibacillus xylanexedens]|uniref:hypothetical protein n=1 Tax=Paenibacillus xylanexedens TaxID=528191 RepID=UPI0011A48D6F|nr:hypothetical protein [Paenibacillus xylanexedens]